MDRRGSMVIAIVAALAMIGLIVGAVKLLGQSSQRSRKPPLVRIEFWIYSCAETLPEHKDLMHRMLAGSPFKGSPIGAREGMTFSDIRFHMGLVRRQGHDLMFHPEYQADLESQPTSEQLERIKECDSLIRVVFISEEPLADLRPLQFSVFAAEAVAALVQAKMILDCEAQAFFTHEQLMHALQKDTDATRFEFNVRIECEELVDSIVVFTRGMNKAGVADLKLSDLPPDHKTLGMALTEAAANALWQRMRLEPVTVEAFGDEFVIECGPPSAASTHRGLVSEIVASRNL